LLTHIKAIDILIRAFASVFKNNFNVELCIGGDGSQRAQLEALTRTLGIES
jgi:glycosyltransferase involved in cell wall biosynthesis